MSGLESLLLGFVPLDLMKDEYADELAGMVQITDAKGIKYVPNVAVAAFMESDIKAEIDAELVAEIEREKIRRGVHNAKT